MWARCWIPATRGSHGVAFEHVIGAFGNARITVGDHPARCRRRCSSSARTGITTGSRVILRRERALTINWLLWQGRGAWSSWPSTSTRPRRKHDIPFGWIVRPCDNGRISPRMWMDVSGPDADGAQLGAALLNDGGYGCDVTGSTMRA